MRNKWCGTQMRNQESKTSVLTLEISEAPFDLIQGRIKYLHENTDFVLALFESLIGYAIIAADFDGNIIAYNEGARQIYGYAPEDLIGKQSTEIFFPKDFIEAGKLENITGELIGKERVSYEGENVREDGRRFPAQILLTLTKDKNGKVVGFIGVVQDITDRKRTEEQLLNAAQQWRITFDSISDMVCLLDMEGKILRCNKAMAGLFKKPFSEIIGRPHWEIVYSTTAPIRECPFMRMRETHRRQTAILPINDRWFNIAVDPLLDETGGLIGAVQIMSDTTERKRAKEEMAALQEQLRQSQKLEGIGQLAGGIAHDFNNLLTIIKGYTQLFLMGFKEGDPLKNNVEEIQKAADRATDLTRQLLVFSRRQIMEMKVLNLNFILENIDKMLRRVIGEDIELVIL
ncbi:MAG: PAS domain S-box protein, partial [Desulfobacterales bacterium]|nr:PAS domain S-box protein [Desulfobacterales bacterium]